MADVNVLNLYICGRCRISDVNGLNDELGRHRVVDVEHPAPPQSCCAVPGSVAALKTITPEAVGRASGHPPPVTWLLSCFMWHPVSCC